jgi:hypothetical protein
VLDTAELDAKNRHIRAACKIFIFESMILFFRLHANNCRLTLLAGTLCAIAGTREIPCRYRPARSLIKPRHPP